MWSRCGDEREKQIRNHDAETKSRRGGKTANDAATKARAMQR